MTKRYKGGMGRLWGARAHALLARAARAPQLFASRRVLSPQMGSKSEMRE